ncbi:hypothetical protein [Streptomyces sp. NPDC058157]|uniref:hypothetical protein n=1 Tax=Streptomyces sp. NPDC058157 TaxID=3346360 RepID=UPI0036E702E2
MTWELVGGVFGGLLAVVVLVEIIRYVLRPPEAPFVPGHHLTADGARLARRLAAQYDARSPTHRVLASLLSQRNAAIGRWGEKWTSAPPVDPATHWEGWREILGRRDRLARRLVREVSFSIGIKDLTYGGPRTIHLWEPDVPAWVDRLEPAPRTAAFEILNRTHPSRRSERLVDSQTGILALRHGMTLLAIVPRTHPNP